MNIDGEKDAEIARLRDTNQVLVHELAAAKRREDKQRVRAVEAERRAEMLPAITSGIRKGET